MTRSEATTLAWPATLAPDREGRLQVRFPDFPEALTDGANEVEALTEAADCLAEAVAARIADDEDLPAPSPPRRGMHAVPLPPVLAYKAALFSAMRRDGISKSELARRLGIDEKDVRRLLDPSYRGSKVERLHAALAACGVAAQITVIDKSRRERLLGSSARPGRGTIRPAAAVATRRAG
ncbi:MAG: type II toxin-antitoxin system HicB family antitoxin [Geminicoccaceae bacterium]